MVGFYAYGAASLALTVTNLTNVTNRVNRQKTPGFIDIAWIMQNLRSQNPYMPSLKRVNRTWVGDDMQFLTDWNPNYYTAQNHDYEKNKDRLHHRTSH